MARKHIIGALNMAGQIKHFCKVCSSPAFVVRIEILNSENTDIHFLCKNKECDHKWVANLTFSHTTTESQLFEENAKNKQSSKLKKSDDLEVDSSQKQNKNQRKKQLSLL